MWIGKAGGSAATRVGSDAEVYGGGCEEEGMPRYAGNP